MNKLNPLFIFFISLGMAGCGNNFIAVSEDEAAHALQNIKPFGTCDRKAVSLINLCTEVIGTDYNDSNYLEVLQSNCEATNGVFSTTNCNPAGSIGACIVGRNQSNEVHTIYYPPQHSEAHVQTDCDSHGGEFQSN